MANVDRNDFKEPIVYTVICTGNQFCVGLKMERDKPGPHFLQIDGRTNITTNSNARKPWRELVPGDSVRIESVGRLRDAGNVPFTTGSPMWTEAKPKPQAIAISGKLIGLIQRRTNLAFVAFKGDAFADGISPYARFYDPMTMTEKTLPTKGAFFRFGEPILVDYAVHPAGTGRPTSRNFILPPQTPYSANFATYSKEEQYEVIGARPLTPAECKSYEEVYNRSDERPEDHRARMIEEILLAGAAAMQVLVDRDLKLGKNTIHAAQVSANNEEVLFSANYHGFGSDSKARSEDLVRAARIFKKNQHVPMGLEARPGQLPFQLALAHIRSSVTHDTHMQFTFAVPAHIADALWNTSWDAIRDQPWTFKPSRPQVLQRHFAKSLRDGSIRKLLLDENFTVAKQIIKAFFGDKDAIPKVEVGATQAYCPAGNVILSGEQTRGIGVALRDDIPLSTIQAPAGSGKTTTIAALIAALAELPNRCTVMTSAMNIAIDTLAAQLAKQTESSYGDEKRIIVFQSAMYLSTRSADDNYHQYRLPSLLTQLSEGQFGPLDGDETRMVRNAVLIAARRYRLLRGMDWGNALHGEVPMDNKDDFVQAIELLLERYKPQIILGTVSALNACAASLQPYVTDVVIDEAGTVAVMDAICFVMTWSKLKSLTMVGDINQLPNFSSPLPDAFRKWGFESALRKARDHANTENTPLTQVFRSHPLLVNILSRFAYEVQGQPLRTMVTAQQRPRMMHSGLPCGDSPVLIVDCPGEHGKNGAMSFTNEEQAHIALTLARMLETRVRGTKVRYLTMYSGARDEVNDLFDKEGLECQATAVDAAQGQECDITVLETALKPDENSKTAFFGMRERITVAISRARDGLVIIGDVEALRSVEEWRRLLDIIQDVCPGCIVTPEELVRHLENNTPGTEMALAFRSIGLVTTTPRRDIAGPSPQSSGNEQEEDDGNWLTQPPPPPPMNQAPGTEAQRRDEVQDFYDQEFDELYEEERRRSADQMGPPSSDAPPAKRSMDDQTRANIAAIQTLIPGLVVPQTFAQQPQTTLETEEEEDNELMEQAAGFADYFEALSDGEVQEDAPEGEDEPVRAATPPLPANSDRSSEHNDGEDLSQTADRSVANAELASTVHAILEGARADEAEAINELDAILAKAQAGAYVPPKRKIKPSLFPNPPTTTDDTSAPAPPGPHTPPPQAPKKQPNKPGRPSKNLVQDEVVINVNDVIDAPSGSKKKPKKTAKDAAAIKPPPKPRKPKGKQTDTAQPPEPRDANEKYAAKYQRNPKKQ